jgi:hypothetical protein
MLSSSSIQMNYNPEKIVFFKSVVSFYKVNYYSLKNRVKPEKKIKIKT